MNRRDFLAQSTTAATLAMAAKLQADENPAAPNDRITIAAIGVKVDARGVSRHGFALNVDMDMSYWQGIIGCGLKDYPVTSLAELCSPPPNMETVIDAVVTAFGEVFGYKMVDESTSLSR